MNGKTLIIAEAGVNHNGSIEIAKKLIDAATEAGADYVKFQTFKAANLVSKSAKKATYQVINTGKEEETQYDMLKKLELSETYHHDLIKHCKKKNIQFFSTAFDNPSLIFLSELGLKLVKIPSGEITNLPYLQLAASLFDQVIISTGMADMSEIKAALDVFLNAGINKENITILHCNTEYPTPMTDVNLLAMQAIQKELGTKVGYSDHTAGIEVPIAAVALGAQIIEKHFTLDKNMPGPDHKASLEPNELKAMIAAIRNIESAMGDGIKKPSVSEAKNIAIARKSLVSVRDMEAGQIVALTDICVKRPGTGISPMKIEMVIGKKLLKAIKADEVITDTHFE